ncbi:MAG: helix-turn-helix domain-containing protein [Clostridia bacterium]|nr:helix-turn-helix domain-containing protein [Clostridia bacterium]
MGRPKGGTNKNHSKEENLALVKRNLSGETLRSIERETGISNSQIYQWTKRYSKT